MIEKTMTRRQFNTLLVAGVMVPAGGLLNSNLATTSFAKDSDIPGIGSYSATSLVKAIKNKKMSATELLKFFIDRHKRLDTKINAVVTTDFEGALKRAQKADEALSRGETWGPLHGLPMTIKDNIEVAGMLTTYGSSYFKNYIDVLLCPVARIAAHDHDHTKIGYRTIQFDNETLNYWDVVGPWNSLSLVSYLPSTVAPIGFTPSGLPVGVQIIGPYLEDYTSIQFARLLERMNGSYKPPNLDIS